MGRQGKRPGAMKKKGEAGAAKNYITRNQALKKLQCTLSDFRRLCILKGIYPREPRSRKKANKGSSAPASFYYVKDIQYLLHEPVLAKLREHKAFAKKLSRAIGRGQWSLAKNLDESKPVYKLDHIIKERYPTFTDALRDLDDAISLIVLFASLPANPAIPSSIVSNCAALAAQWQLYVMRTRSLRKVFLSIKGIYFQAEVQGQLITWLVPYLFTQTIPNDLDFRIMLTFLELYQTLLGFTFFKLYTDVNLVYPPKLDRVLDDGAAGIGALLLEESGGRGLVVAQDETVDETERKKVFAKDVRQKIREIGQGRSEQLPQDGADENDEPTSAAIADPSEVQLDQFTVAPSKNATEVDDVPQPESFSSAASLFDRYFFFLSREVTRPTLEFVIRSFGGQVGWDPVLGAGSPLKEDDPRITHHVIDRPAIPSSNTPHPGKRAYVQPQWVVDCVNRRTLLPTDEYAPGKSLPPHLSPFVNEDEVRERGGYVPMDPHQRRTLTEGEEDEEEEEDEEDEEDEEEEMDQDEGAKKTGDELLAAAAQDPALLHAAELEAEAKGISPAQFQADLANAKKKNKPTTSAESTTKPQSKRTQEEQLASIMLTGKQKKLYKKMAYSADKRAAETEKLKARAKAIEKERKKGAKQAL